MMGINYKKYLKKRDEIKKAGIKTMREFEALVKGEKMRFDVTAKHRASRNNRRIKGKRPGRHTKRI